jgi:hypothetical protein
MYVDDFISTNNMTEKIYWKNLTMDTDPLLIASNPDLPWIGELLSIREYDESEMIMVKSARKMM